MRAPPHVLLTEQQKSQNVDRSSLGDRDFCRRVISEQRLRFSGTQRAVPWYAHDIAPIQCRSSGPAPLFSLYDP